MKILLLQNMLYLPALGGANKGNRELLERLAASGHRCFVVAPAQSPHGPGGREEVVDALQKRGVNIRSSSTQAEVFELNGVEAHLLHDFKTAPAYLDEFARAHAIDCVLAGADDPSQTMLSSALALFPGRVVFLARTTFFLPFGPRAAIQNALGAKDISRVRAIVCNSRYVADYIRAHLVIETAPRPQIHHVPLPVLGLRVPEKYGGAGFNSGFVTMVNPCQIKGICIFADLARRFPDVQFAAVPTWATTSKDREILSALPNVRLLPPTEDPESIFAQTRVLLMPSLWDEAFGRTVVEAMLHGIPVLASNVGGLPEAKLGVDYLLPVREIELYEYTFDEHRLPTPIVPPQDIAPWENALREILGNEKKYHDISTRSRRAATEFVSAAKFSTFENLLLRIASDSSASPPPLPREKKTAVNLSQLTPDQRTALALKALAAKKNQPKAEFEIPTRPSNGGPLPASFVQEQLYFLQLASPNNPSYIVPQLIEIRGPLYFDALRRAIDALVARHEPLRTNFLADANGIQQIISPPRPAEFKIVNSARELEAEKTRPFDLARDLMIRASLWKKDSDHHQLILTLHHLICDAQSIRQLFNELAALYRQFAEGTPANLSPLRVQYADFALWERAQCRTKDNLPYWVERLTAVPPILNLPRKTQTRGDQSNPALVSSTIGGQTYRHLKALAAQEGVTQFILFLAAFEVILHRISAQSRVVIGYPADLREGPFQNTFGFVGQTRFATSSLETPKTFRQFLAQTKKEVLEAHRHRAFQFHRLVEALRPKRARSQLPLIQVLFRFAPDFEHRIELRRTSFELVQMHPPAQIDLILFVREHNGEFEILFKFHIEMFDAAVVEEWMTDYRSLLDEVALNPDLIIAPPDASSLRSNGETSSSLTSPSASCDEVTGNLEHQIAEIWKTSLKISTLRRGDNYFDLGGHSLLAISMLARLQRAVGIEVPLATFLENPTVAGLAAALARPAQTPSHKSLVLLRDGDRRAPLFLAHAHSGQPLNYLPFVRALKTNRAIYGFQSAALVSGNESSSIEEIAARYRAEMQSLQPNGPYHLAGACLGGFIAYEMAVQLAAAGEATSYLGLIATVSPRSVHEFRQRRTATRPLLDLLTRAHFEGDLLLRVHRKDKMLRYRERAQRFKELLGLSVARGRLNGADNGVRSPAAQREYLRRAYAATVANYHPRPYGGEITLYRPRIQPWGSRRTATLGWSNFLTGHGKVIVHTLPGSYTTLLVRPNLDVVADLVSNSLNKEKEPPLPTALHLYEQAKFLESP